MAKAECNGKYERDPGHSWQLQGKLVQGATNLYVCANCKGRWYKTPDEED